MHPVFSLWLRCCFLLLLLPSAAQAQAVKDLPRPTDYVSDDAHVLSAQAVAGLDRLCGALERQAHAQMAIVTVANTDEEPIADYAVQLEDAWKVGAKGTDRGVILLVSIGDRKLFISTGYGLEGVITDEKAGIIARQMRQYLHVSQNDEGITLGAEQLAGLIAQDAGVQLQVSHGQPAADNTQHLGPGQLTVLAGVFLLLLVLAARTGLLPFLLGMFLSSSFNSGGSGRGRDDDDGDGFSGFGGGSTGGGGAGDSF